MARRKSKAVPAQRGWAIYLRTSDEESQNPEASQARQRFIIDRAVLERSDLPIIGIYKDVLTGRTPLRTDYQRMLEDARLGKFSHVVVERADRFGRNDTEALRAIDELDEFGVSVRFANHPDLDPMDPDDRVIVALSFTLARRESMLSGHRIKGAGETKRRNGGYLGLHPDGYISVEDDQPGRKSYMKKGHHLEQDPERAKIWRFAWDLLLEDRLTLAEIAEELHARGYRHRSGQPFVEVKENGKRKANYNTVADIFHNWTYAGWIVSEEAGIPPKTLRGNWEPIVTTEEFERGLEILTKRSQNKYTRRKHDYLLKGLLYLSAAPNNPTMAGDKLYRLQCSTSNTQRSGGGTAHYRLERHPIHFLCSDVEEQVAVRLHRVQVNHKLMTRIREYYIEEVADKLGRLRPDERAEIERSLKQIDDEEARVLRLYASGMVTEENWRDLWAEWQDKRQRLRGGLELLDQRCETYISDLDEALNIIAKLGILYETLPHPDQKELLRNVVERVVLNPEGNIIRVDWLPPFAYLQEVSEKVSCGRSSSENLAENQTSGDAGCSSGVLDCGSAGTRTQNQLIKSQLRYHCATDPTLHILPDTFLIFNPKKGEFAKLVMMQVDAISLEVFKNLFASVAEEMGLTLQRAAFSPNIRERLDFSCAVFDFEGKMVAQAAHIPVHLGSMPASVEYALKAFADFKPGDVVILNDPYRGGTHLPDITMVSPVFYDNHPVFYVASRAHHADVGGMSPGSLPLSTELYQEGIIIPPVKIYEAGQVNEGVRQLILANSRAPEERTGDLAAQLAAHRTGEQRLQGMIAAYGYQRVFEHAVALQDYARQMIEALIADLPDGEYSFRDGLESDGQAEFDIPIQATITIQGSQMTVDFSGSAPQVAGNVNAVRAIVRSATWYCVRLLAGDDVPVNHGCFEPVKVVIPEHSLLDPDFPAAVAVGNTETGQRVVDVVLGALAQALPDRIPTASQGSMNNLTVGSSLNSRQFVYYETIGGGHGASAAGHGLSARHSHMTNTLNTPVEALEYTMPLRVLAYACREASGGAGKYRGGEGIRRTYEFLTPATMTINSERRLHAPYGLQGGQSGAKGINRLVRRDGESQNLGSKCTLRVETGDRLYIETPGGGGWGSPE